MFGTHLKPEGWPQTHGCRGYVPPKGYVAQLLAPWRNPGIELSEEQRVELQAKAASRTARPHSGRTEDLVTVGAEPPPAINGPLDLDPGWQAKGGEEIR